MIDLFDELLSICIDRLTDGDTVADCLADFPECPELELMLETAAALTALREERSGEPWLRGSLGGVAAPKREPYLRRTA